MWLLGFVAVDSQKGKVDDDTEDGDDTAETIFSCWCSCWCWPWCWSCCVAVVDIEAALLLLLLAVVPAVAVVVFMVVVVSRRCDVCHEMKLSVFTHSSAHLWVGAMAAAGDWGGAY